MEELQLDDECWKILKALSSSPKTPQMIAQIYGVPISDTWKRIHFLEGLGIINVVLAFITRDGRVLYFYEVAEPITIPEESGGVVLFEPAV